MRATNWTSRTDFASVCRRASGRRRYNAERQYQADVRRFWVFHMLADLPSHLWSRYGVQATVAKIFGVHRSTICRDFAEFRRPVLRIFKSAPFRKMFRSTLSPEERADLRGDTKL